MGTYRNWSYVGVYRDYGAFQVRGRTPGPKQRSSIVALGFKVCDCIGFRV